MGREVHGEILRRGAETAGSVVSACYFPFCKQKRVDLIVEADTREVAKVTATEDDPHYGGRDELDSREDERKSLGSAAYPVEPGAVGASAERKNEGQVRGPSAFD